MTTQRKKPGTHKKKAKVEPKRAEQPELKVLVLAALKDTGNILSSCVIWPMMIIAGSLTYFGFWFLLADLINEYFSIDLTWLLFFISLIGAIFILVFIGRHNANQEKSGGKSHAKRK